MLRKLLLILFAVLALRTSQAATYFVAGEFQHDDDLAQFAFTVAERCTLITGTSSYSAGGFDPVLALFQASGPQTLLALNDDQTPGTLDSGITITLDPGSYLLALTQSPNLPLGPTLADGFLLDGAGDFTGGPFLDIFGQQRTGAWSLNIELTALPAAPTDAPEPGTQILTGLALIVSGGISRLRRR